MEWKVVVVSNWGMKYQLRVGHENGDVQYLDFLNRESAVSTINAIKENPTVVTVTLREVKELELHYKG